MTRPDASTQTRPDANLRTHRHEPSPVFSTRSPQPQLSFNKYVTMNPIAAKLDLKRKLADITNPTLQALHCPICNELPRQAPIFNCTRGHLICADCKPKVDTCPLCRCPNITQRNQFAERLLATALDGLVLDCKNKDDGCTARDLAHKLVDHEKICVYRHVQCPARHRRACNWTGPLSKMLLHVIDTKCAQIVKCRENGVPFVSVIGDFNVSGMTVFGRKAMTHWKPVLLISREFIRLFVYLVIYRDEAGNWIIYARSFASDEGLEKIWVTITVNAVDAKNNPEGKEEDAKEKPEGRQEADIALDDKQKEEEMFSFTGRILNQRVTEQEVIDSGNFLCLKDSQVKKMTVDRTLLQYTVRISERM